MARNLDNLMPIQQVNAMRTKEQHSADSRKGGIAAQKTLERKRIMRNMLEMCLEMKNNKGMSYRELATMGLIKGAINGNANNYKTILETLGELNIKDEENKSNGVIDDLLEALNNAKKN